MTTQQHGQWGTQTQPGTYPPGYTPGLRPRNGMGVAALVLGLLGFFTSLVVVGGVLGVLAIVFGAIGRGRARRDEATNGGMALAGIILGTIAALITVGALLFASVFTDEINDLNSCNQNAATQAQREACAEQFGEDVAN